MKRFAVVLLLTMLLTGCGNKAVEQAEPVNSFEAMFERHSIDDYYSILVDKETKVCYLEYKSYCNGFYGITIMLNADGAPKLWEE